MTISGEWSIQIKALHSLPTKIFLNLYFLMVFAIGNIFHDSIRRISDTSDVTVALLFREYVR